MSKVTDGDGDGLIERSGDGNVVDRITGLLIPELNPVGDWHDAEFPNGC